MHKKDGDVPNKTELAKYYFTLRDQAWDNGKGHTKLEIHQMAKQQIWPMLIDEAANFTDPTLVLQRPSTLHLSEQGWLQFIEQFKAMFLYV